MTSASAVQWPRHVPDILSSWHWLPNGVRRKQCVQTTTQINKHNDRGKAVIWTRGGPSLIFPLTDISAKFCRSVWSSHVMAKLNNLHNRIYHHFNCVAWWEAPIFALIFSDTAHWPVWGPPLVIWPPTLSSLSGLCVHGELLGPAQEPFGEIRIGEAGPNYINNNNIWEGQ